MPARAIAVNLLEFSEVFMDKKPKEENRDKEERPKEYINGREVEYVEPKEAMEDAIQDSPSWISKER